MGNFQQGGFMVKIKLRKSKEEKEIERKIRTRKAKAMLQSYIILKDFREKSLSLARKLQSSTIPS